MQTFVTCIARDCGQRQEVARLIDVPETFYIVCINCERTLCVDVSWDDIRTAQDQASQRQAAQQR